MMDALGDPRVGACFDTCHAFASGYDERTAEAADATLEEWERVVGKLEVVHCNDSETGLGSNRDRHASIGAGQIGDDGYLALLHEPRLDRFPISLEVPVAQKMAPLERARRALAATEALLRRC